MNQYANTILTIINLHYLYFPVVVILLESKKLNRRLTKRLCSLAILASMVVVFMRVITGGFILIEIPLVVNVILSLVTLPTFYLMLADHD